MKDGADDDLAIEQGRLSDSSLARLQAPETLSSETCTRQHNHVTPQ